MKSPSAHNKVTLVDVASSPGSAITESRVIAGQGVGTFTSPGIGGD